MQVEDADKSFLNDIIKEEDEQDHDPNEKEEQLKRGELEKEVADAVDEILEEARIETSKWPQPTFEKMCEESESIENSIIQIAKKDVFKLPNELPVIGTTRAEKHLPRAGPPSVPPPPPPGPSIQNAAIEDDNKFEANFEANFDGAFGVPKPKLPKQLGGRASIPDELEPHQLERLQSLKESNA